MLVFNKYFYKKKKSKLYFGDRVTVLNDFIYQTGGSTPSLRSFFLDVAYLKLSVEEMAEQSMGQTWRRAPGGPAPGEHREERDPDGGRARGSWVI
jgi:hypothetical protein